MSQSTKFQISLGNSFDMLFKFLAPFFLVGCCIAASNEFTDLLKNITTQDQLHFVQYHVAKGYFVANNFSTEGFENGFPDDYSKGMFEAFLEISKDQNKSYGTTMRLATTKLGSQICGPHGPCFDPDDAGTHP
ncbi:uncharacterized protein LOC123315304 [Coccinella septempunctata]|uniref:uncharacterized protein LOC123315304 n=1 Tax=Coccinella septempunctata TaxID=41139 RepID=UPI001D06927F|nr:uncharacterized protein LOC123315304 [Coccinella septempunctata]